MFVVKLLKTLVIGLGLCAAGVSAVRVCAGLLGPGHLDLFAPFPAPWGPPLPALFLFGVSFLIFGVMISFYERAMKLS